MRGDPEMKDRDDGQVLEQTVTTAIRWVGQNLEASSKFFVESRGRTPQRHRRGVCNRVGHSSVTDGWKKVRTHTRLATCMVATQEAQREQQHVESPLDRSR